MGSRRPSTIYDKKKWKFTEHFRKFRSLWTELDMLRPATTDTSTFNERREQDKVFGLILLSSTFNDQIKHI